MLPQSFWILLLLCPRLPPGSVSSVTVISLPVMSSSQSLITVLGRRGQGQSLEALEVSLQVDTDSLISILWGQQFNPPNDMVTQPCVSILFTRTSQDALSRASATSRHTTADTVSFLSGCQPCREKKSGTVDTASFWGLFAFVAIPLPGTGAWTGALVANVLNVKKLKASITILLGVIAAGLIVSIFSYGLLSTIINLF